MGLLVNGIDGEEAPIIKVRRSRYPFQCVEQQRTAQTDSHPVSVQCQFRDQVAGDRSSQAASGLSAEPIGGNVGWGDDVISLLAGSALDESRDGFLPSARGRTDLSPVCRADPCLDALEGLSVAV